jgi:hypothetical protein
LGLLDHLLGKSTRETRLERVAGWCLWITVWGPILATLLSLQEDVEYSFFIRYRNLVFSALLIQISLRLAQARELNAWKTALLVLLAALQNPIWMVHFGVRWPWWIINAATAVASCMAVAEVSALRRSKESARAGGRAMLPGTTGGIQR